MLRTLLRASAVAATFLLGGAAQAADIAPAAGYDWTGFYLGANVGYGWGSTSYSSDVRVFGAPAAAPARAPIASGSPVDIDYDGIVGGGQIGYNMQIHGLVLGLEADVSASGVQGDTKSSDNAPCQDQGCSAEANWFGTGRLRVGYAIDSFLPYVTGGAAVVGIQGDVDKSGCDGGCSYDDTTWGWTLGGGVEWGFADNWSAKAEYLYINVDSPDFSGQGGGNVKSDNLDINVVRVGINYRIQ